MTADKCLAKHKAFLYLSHLATLAGYYGDVARKERMYRAANRVIATIQDRRGHHVTVSQRRADSA